MIKEYHLDSIYRDRYQKYMSAEGNIYDSRQVYWRVIPWERLVAIKTVIKKKVYLTTCKHPGFKFFIVYRWGGQEVIAGKPVPIREWAVGWSDGINAFMTDIDFKTGEIVRRSIIPIETIQSHIHPRIEGRYRTTPLEDQLEI